MLDAEDTRWRGRPSSPYRESGDVLRIGPVVLGASLEMLARFGSVESCVFWYGDRFEGGGEVRGVVAPRQTMRWGNFNVSPAAMVQMADLVDEHAWRPLAQVHSHPGRNVEHSWYDDRMISSKRVLSLVIPFYGKWSGRWPEGIGIHEYQNDYWHFLGTRSAAQRVVLTDKGPEILKADLRL